MKVVVLGGYGVFGARLVRLLARDGHDVVVAGRNLAKAQALAGQVGATALAVDRAGDLTPLWAAVPDVVVDAAGPFHAYGDDPYRLPRSAIAAGVHYLDLADDADFCAGIATLDAAARAAGVFAISGASSVPAISSAAVVALAQGQDIDTISTAILPGNRAPRGRAVVESILHQCGVPMAVPVDGQKGVARGWSQRAKFDLGCGVTRPGYMIAVPDQRLFADAFGARSVMFRAGLELRVMNHSLALLSWLRAKWRFPILGWFVTALLWLAERLKPFGSDTGGMVVRVTVKTDHGWQDRFWRLFAGAGEGPFIPAVAVRAILRDTKLITPGARPAVAVVSLTAVEAAMDDLAVTTERFVGPRTPIFAQVLGDDFATLPPTIQAAHDVPGPRIWEGRAKVTRGASLWSRLVAGLFGFPKAQDDMSVSVTMTPQNGGELWERRFDGKPFWSFLRPKDGVMTERFGPLTFTLGLHVADGALHYPVLAGHLGWVPLPRFLLPQSITREYEADGRFHFDVALMAPLSGAPMVHYQGWLERGTSSLGDRDQHVVERPQGAVSGHDPVGKRA